MSGGLKLDAACFGHRVSHATLGPLGQPEKAMGQEFPIELWSPNLTTFCFAGFGTDRLRRQEAMETAGRENPKRWAIVPSNRAHGAGGQNSSRSIKWAAKQENFQPKGTCFFLTSTFIELTRQVRPSSSQPRSTWRSATLAASKRL